MPPVASFHLVTYPRKVLLAKLLNIPAERWELSEAQGCTFGRILGTGREHTTRTSISLSRWAAFAVWKSEEDLEEFLTSSTLAKRWADSASTLKEYRLEPLMARGRWDGQEPLGEMPPPSPSADTSRPVAALTRASIPLVKWVRFSKAIGPVDDHLRQSPGCSLAVGMGEWPVGKLATFSIWESEQALSGFAYDGEAHSRAIAARYKENWFSEEFFCRFAVRDLAR